MPTQRLWLRLCVAEDVKARADSAVLRSVNQVSKRRGRSGFQICPGSIPSRLRRDGGPGREVPDHKPMSSWQWQSRVYKPCVHSTRQGSSTALEMHRTTPGLPPHPSTHLEPVHQLQGLAVVLVGFEDDIGQFVDDDVQGALLLDWPAKVQLQAGDTEKKNNFSS